jgi:Zn ribbon nucleic-acid-binding protein
MKIKECPRCKSKDLIFLPWLGLIYICRKCGYKGPLILEKKETNKHASK